MYILGECPYTGAMSCCDYLANAHTPTCLKHTSFNFYTTYINKYKPTNPTARTDPTPNNYYSLTYPTNTTYSATYDPTTYIYPAYPTNMPTLDIHNHTGVRCCLFASHHFGSILFFVLFLLKKGRLLNSPDNLQCWQIAQPISSTLIPWHGL